MVAVSANQRHPPRLKIGVEDVKQANEFFWCQRRAAFETNWVANATEVLDVSAIDIPGTIANPEERADR